MDLNIRAEDAQISTTRSSGQITVYLSGVDEQDLLSTENFQSIGINKFVGEFGAEEVLEYLKNDYPELFEKDKE